MGFKENACVILNNDIISFSKGLSYEVEFDFIDIWYKIKDKDLTKNQLCFLHTHPHGMGTSCSSKDENCLEGLYQALKIPIVFIICSFQDDTYDIKKMKYSKFIYSEDNNFNVKSINIKKLLKVFTDRIRNEMVSF
jgi:hypothetical protein